MVAASRVSVHLVKVVAAKFLADQMDGCSLRGLVFQLSELRIVGLVPGPFIDSKRLYQKELKEKLIALPTDALW